MNKAINKLKIGDKFIFNESLGLIASYSGSGELHLPIKSSYRSQDVLQQQQKICRTKKAFQKLIDLDNKHWVPTPDTYEGAIAEVVKLNAKSVVISLDSSIWDKTKEASHILGKKNFRLNYNKNSQTLTLL